MRLVVPLLASGLLLGSAPSADAHAFLERAEPAVGSTVGTAPAALTLRFSEPLELAFSVVRVQDATGARVDRNDATADPTDRRALRIGLQALRPGTYKVTWRVVSVDTHVTTGDFVFHVAPP